MLSDPLRLLDAPVQVLPEPDQVVEALLDLPQPTYHHHRLILGPDGRKLSKSHRDTGLAVLREKGLSPADIRAMAF